MTSSRSIAVCSSSGLILLSKSSMELSTVRRAMEDEARRQEMIRTSISCLSCGTPAAGRTEALPAY